MSGVGCQLLFVVNCFVGLFVLSLVASFVCSLCFDIGFCLLFVFCVFLFVVCCSLFCCALFVAGCLSNVVSCLLFVGCCV